MPPPCRCGPIGRTRRPSTRSADLRLRPDRLRRGRRATGLPTPVAAGALAFTACASDPGPKRVAQDIIEAEAFRNPDLDKDCLLRELDRYSDSDLRQISSDLNSDNAADREAGEAALLAYQRSLEICL